MEQEKRKILKRWLRRVIAGGVYTKAPDWVILEIHNLGVPIQLEAERHGTKWEWVVYLEDRYCGEKVDGEDCARKALAAMERQDRKKKIGRRRVNKKRIRRE